MVWHPIHCYALPCARSLRGRRRIPAALNRISSIENKLTNIFKLGGLREGATEWCLQQQDILVYSLGSQQGTEFKTGAPRIQSLSDG